MAKKPPISTRAKSAPVILTPRDKKTLSNITQLADGVVKAARCAA